MGAFHDNLVQSFANFKAKYIGSTDISSIGDGTASGAIAENASNISDIQTNYVQKSQLTFTVSGDDLYITKTY